ncbi:MAG: hypothetical protein ABR568_09810 [Pyrinomonadaceae bacterium]
MTRVKQQKIELGVDEFAKGVNDAIRAVRALYGGVRSMLDELTAQLQEPPQELSRLRVPVQPLVKPNSPPDEKFLRSWIGRLYTFERDGDETDDKDIDYDEDPGDAPSGKKQIELYLGQDLAFIKVVLFQSHSSSDQLEPPHLLYGVLRNCQVDTKVGQDALSVNRDYFRRIVEDLHRTTAQGGFTTRAFCIGWASKKQKGIHALKFTLDSPPLLSHSSISEDRSRFVRLQRA